MNVWMQYNFFVYVFINSVGGILGNRVLNMLTNIGLLSVQVHVSIL